MDRKIIDYKIIVNVNSSALEEIVKSYIAEGWTLHGSIAINVGSSGYSSYVREIVKYEKENKNKYLGYYGYATDGV